MRDSAGRSRRTIDPQLEPRSKKAMADQALAVQQVDGRYVIKLTDKTMLWGDSEAEVWQKVAQSYQQLDSALAKQNDALERLRKQPTLRKPVEKFEPKPLTGQEQQQAFIDAQNPATFQKAVKAVVDSVLPVE